MGKKTKKKNKGFAQVLLEAGAFILLVLFITFLMSRFVVERVRVQNHSMEPTLSSGDMVLIDKISYRFRDPKRFDIIVFKQKGTGEALIKRVIGLPNETVRIADGKIYIDEKEITDVKNTDVPEDAGSAQNGLKLSAGEYFVLGDNRKESIDSRYDQVGIVSSTKITGRMFMRLSPLTKIKFF